MTSEQQKQIKKPIQRQPSITQRNPQQTITTPRSYSRTPNYTITIRHRIKKRVNPSPDQVHPHATKQTETLHTTQRYSNIPQYTTPPTAPTQQNHKPPNPQNHGPNNAKFYSTTTTQHQQQCNTTNDQYHQEPYANTTRNKKTKPKPQTHPTSRTTSPTNKPQDHQEKTHSGELSLYQPAEHNHRAPIN